MLWRLSTLLAVFKSGSPCLHKSFRLIFVKVQLGLLQEGLVEARLKPTIRTFLHPCQSGYFRGIQDPHLVLHEIYHLAEAAHRAVWLVMGDFKQAFPRVWRELLLQMIHKDIGIGHGMLELLASILEFDEVHVWLSGVSCVRVTQGVPEGGNIGPLCYNVLPNSLVRRLEAKSLGLGIVKNMPGAWLEHKWQGHGTPCDALVSSLRDRLRAGGALPSAGLLCASPVLEASAAQALDLEASVRIPCQFHADDPILLSSTRGGLQRILDEVLLWSRECGACFHVGPNKTVAMAVGVDAPGDTSLSFDGVELNFVALHKWLGIRWPNSADFSSFLSTSLQVASVMAAQLAGLASMGAISWLALCELFESKVDSLLDMGRWVFIMVPDAELRINAAYDGWARSFLGAVWWRNAAVCASELGWCLNGYSRVVLAVAMRRAKLWVDDGWHAQFFKLSGAAGCGWALRSSTVLEECGIVDWPVWCISHCPIVEDYCTYVKGVLHSRCKVAMAARIAKHHQRLPYDVLNPLQDNIPKLLHSLAMPHEVLMLVRHWCRLRCGLVSLRHMHGRDGSRALHQNCIFCEATTSHPLVHCIALCPRWQLFRADFRLAVPYSSSDRNQEFTRQVLGSNASRDGLIVAIRWAASLDYGASNFWAEHS